MIHPAKRLQLLALGGLPALVTTFLMIMYLSAKHVMGLTQFMPILPIIPIFYWGMMARDMPYLFVFLVGIVMDAVTGLPMGLSSMMYLFFLMMVRSQRKFFHKEIFMIKWGYFGIFLAIMMITNWFTLAFFMPHHEPFVPAFLQWLLTSSIYPVFHRLFDGLYHFIYDRRWRILHGQ